MKSLGIKVLPKSVQIIFALLSLLSLLFVWDIGPIVTSDSRAYFGMWPYVSGGYPFFLRGLHAVFGMSFHNVAVGIQFFGVIGSIFLFLTIFLAKFKMKQYQLLILLVVLFYPIIDSNLLIVNNISTEGLSYMLFLVLILTSYFIYVSKQRKFYVLLVLITTILITIRGQFKFLIPLFVIIELITQIKDNRINLKIIGVIITIPILTFMIDVSYHRLIQKQFFVTPFTWTTLVSSVMFVSDESDSQYIENEEAKIIFKLIHKEFRAKKIGYRDHKYFQEPIDYNYTFYHYEFPTICNQTVQQVAVKYFEKKHNDKIKAYIDTENIHKQLFFDLLPHNFSKWIALAFQNFKNGFGGITVALIYIIIVILLLKYYIMFNDKVLLFSAFLIIIMLANKTLVSVTVHSIIRYFFYTNWIPIFLLFLGINRLKIKAH